MADTADPITLNRFVSAIHDLPISRLYATVDEIRNARRHLKRSNDEMKIYVDAGDQDCRDAVHENAEVLKQMRQRLEALKREVSERGLLWRENEEDQLSAATGFAPGRKGRGLFICARERTPTHQREVLSVREDQRASGSSSRLSEISPADGIDL